ncbi:histidine phosphatase family protein [Pseudomonas sp. MN1F]|uniref:lipopolysaccharide core heptose(II)-phosphate phosphatase PmrG n=1 Tax=Pseudomonas sp. MN1F TaxID=1366632 RepID=UPI00128F3708|nr:histidine phosphatase family protein [Pseudomonas sp. MN1F]MQG92564.1 histidine phosphatase family protein [Pseudomonas sp. MN1F]
MNKKVEITTASKPVPAGLLRSCKILLAAMCIVASGVTVYSWGKSTSPQSLEHASPVELENVKIAWGKGEIIAIVRHAERCDQSDAPCLSLPDGITARGRGEAVRLGGMYRALGLTKTDVFYSPVTRTKQTATAMFNEKAEGQEWLASCENSLLEDAFKHKLKGHNLVLVTHSGCIENVERALGLDAPDKPDYISTLFLSVDDNDKKATILGMMPSSGFNALNRTTTP